MAQTYLLYIAAIFYRQLKRAKTGKGTKINAFGCYVGYSLALVILYTTVFMGLVGVEELADTAIISDLYARALPLVFLGGIAVVAVSSLGFALVEYFIIPEHNDQD